ncbi:MAG: potassium channel family protein [Pseudomonadota bacterium]
MDNVLFLILRQMRVPLLLLSTVYAIATFGLTVIPGLDDEGNVWYMDYFHAFYFISFMGTTIGFGELPYAFTHAQRMWALVFMYISVATWIYAIGSLISLLGNETLRQAFTEYRFGRQVRQLREPFFLICGYGDTGSKLVRSLRLRFLQASALDIKQSRIDALMLEDDPMFVPALCADAANPDNLIKAGITHPLCQSVVALTNDNAVNLHIAITARVLNPALRVICRADSHEVEDNMASFGTDYIIDPFDTFAKNLALATYAPHQFQLVQWFRQARGAPLSEITRVPMGRWIICGFGRFGQAIHKEMTEHNIQSRIIEPNSSIEALPEDAIIGYGTDAVTLTEADVQNAVGIIAGSDDDSNNLSIVVTAKELNPDLFVIVRQTQNANRPLFASAQADIVMEPSEVISSKIRSLLTNPAIDEFLSLARAHDDEWARHLTERLRAFSSDIVPHTWFLTINETEAAAVVEAMQRGQQVRIEHLTRSHVNRDEKLPLLPLFHANDTGSFCIPDIYTPLQEGDRLLFAGTRASHSRMLWNLSNTLALEYVMTGATLPQTSVGRWLHARFS